MLAAKSGHAEVCRRLVELGANMCCTNTVSGGILRYTPANDPPDTPFCFWCTSSHMTGTAGFP